MAIEIKAHAEGVIVPVKAQPNARKTGVQGEQAGALKVAVTAPPEDGKANAAIVEVLKEFFGVKRSQVELISGQTSRQKQFMISGATAEEIRAKLDSI